MNRLCGEKRLNWWSNGLKWVVQMKIKLKKPRAAVAVVTYGSSVDEVQAQQQIKNLEQLWKSATTAIRTTCAVMDGEALIGLKFWLGTVTVNINEMQVCCKKFYMEYKNI